MRVRSASLGISQAVTLRAAVENRGMRSVCRNPVGGEAHDEEGLGRFTLLPPAGVGVGVGLSPAGVDEGSFLGGEDEGSLFGVDEGSLLGGVDEGLLSRGVEEGRSAGVEVGVLLIRLLVSLPDF